MNLNSLLAFYCKLLRRTVTHNQWWILSEANEATALGPPFWSCRGAPLLKMMSLVLGYFVAF